MAPQLETSFSPSSPQAAARQTAMESLVGELKANVSRAAEGGSEKARAKHLSRGKLLPRERVERLLDPGTAFLELSPLAAHDLYGGEAPGAGADHRRRTRLGSRVRDRLQRPDREGRDVLPDHRQEAPACAGGRARRTTCRASTSSTPAVRSCRCRTRSSPTATHFGRIFFNQATMSARWIPQVAAVLGTCTAGGAYVPAMSDETVIVKGAGDDLPRRAAAREGGDRRGGHRRGARRCGRPCAHVRRRRPLRARRRRTRSRSSGRSSRTPTVARRCRRTCGSRRSRSTTRLSSTRSSRPTRASPTTCAR